MQIDAHVIHQLGDFRLDATLAAPTRGITALFGRSGAGKSTLINAIAGLTRPDGGHIRIGATTFFDAAAGIDLPVEQRGVGYVFQDARLFPHCSVETNLRYGQKRVRARAGSQQPTVDFDAVVDMLALRPLLQRRPGNLSGGEKQRVAIGRALLAQPRLLLMDEPLAALDAPRKAEVMPCIERLRDEFEVPVLYVSHALDEVTRLADHLVLMSEGRTVAEGEPLTLLSSPEHAPLFGRYEAGSVLECRVVGHDSGYQLSTLGFADGKLRVPLVDLPEGAAVRVRLRAREVAVALDHGGAPPADLSISNRLRGQVAAMVPRHGPYVDVVIDLGHSQIRALITRESADRLQLAPGTPVWALIKSVALDRRSVAA